MQPYSPVLHRFALANLVVNVAIVVTGGAVRLSNSGLGCPTWPRCTDDSYVATPEMGIHGAIEFGNRTLTGVVGVIALISVLLAWRMHRRGELRWALGVLAGVAVQGLVGGATVRVRLNPWVVGMHFLLSIALIAVTYGLVRATARIGSPNPPNPRGARPLVIATTVASAAVLVAGVLVTGAGPHSGDTGAARNGFDPEQISQIHADLVFLVLGLTLAAVFLLPGRAPKVLLGVLLGQGLIGFVQYFTDLPRVLVAAHMLGACLVWIATLRLWPSIKSAAGPSGELTSASTVGHQPSAERSLEDNLTVANTAGNR
ncbi:cytochrome c oxidase assembly protein subunit 15 [Allocatelliglobosispora scoriae]|uniref:Cytochrome c oxidase assembly protein subunit 15 n=1 Tax=Allocatelliglobosispora scoriae TaxID=643052 RepID=A0A841BQY9_9ACTN|nr:COX15/CtaA family protein [Allocatelliglobosispora scoriae]MBB5869230.1 cytochrome c oxidase assembly protein subunit 15 [Allocatelliglobosispora scoriae]